MKALLQSDIFAKQPKLYLVKAEKTKHPDLLCGEYYPYDSFKYVKGHWLYEKLASAVDTVWFSQATCEIEVGFGLTPELAKQSKQIIRPYTSILITVEEGGYIAWKGDEGLVRQVQSVRRK